MHNGYCPTTVGKEINMFKKNRKQKVFNSQDSALKYLKDNRYRSYESFTHKTEIYRIYRGSFGRRVIFKTENRDYYDNVGLVPVHKQTKYIVEEL